MKKKLTLSIDADLVDTIHQKTKENKDIDVSKMVEDFLRKRFDAKLEGKESFFENLRGVLRELPDDFDWKKEREERLAKKYLNE